MVTRHELVKQVPTRRIQSYDGMAVTAEIWEEAHAYHRQRQRLHALLSHGVGIVTGLEVVASEPPDTAVNILPGVAIDPTGQTIVLPDPVAYDIGSEMSGTIYLLLSYGEGRPRKQRDEEAESGKRYTYDEFSISAHTTLPASPYVELARIKRRDRNDHFLAAEKPVQPGANEIDLRFRREIGAAQQVSVAVCYLGESTDLSQGAGLFHLAHELNLRGRYHIAVDDYAPFAPEVDAHMLVYLVGKGRVKASPNEIGRLANYVEMGRGTLFVEGQDERAQADFLDLLTEMGRKPGPLSPGHSLLVDPHLFAAPPPGYSPTGKASVLVSPGVIYSGCNYGLLWQGKTDQGAPTREQIRSAVEFGANIFAYASNRRPA